MPTVRQSVTFQALAARVGVSRKRVMSAIARGEIKQSRIGKDGAGRMVIVDDEGAESDLRSAVELSVQAEAVGAEGIDFDDPETWPTHLPGLRAVREHHVTRQAKIKADQSAGLLIESAKVRRDWFEAARMIRDQLQKIPDRVAHTMAARLGVQDVDSVRALLRDDIERALRDLSDSLANKVPQEP